MNNSIETHDQNMLYMKYLSLDYMKRYPCHNYLDKNTMCSTVKTLYQYGGKMLRNRMITGYHLSCIKYIEEVGLCHIYHFYHFICIMIETTIC